MADRRYQGSSSRRGAKGQGGYRGQGGYIGKMSQDRSPKSRNSRGGQKGGRGRGAGRPQRPAPVRSDMLMIEGRRAVAEALDTGVKLTRAYVSAPDGDASLQELMSRLEAANVPIEEVSHRELDARSSHGAHQGIMVKCAPFAYASVRDIINRAGERRRTSGEPRHLGQYDPGDRRIRPGRGYVHLIGLACA
jgi:23S rRNA (guanosine2251-2'-O)-methyltransferase